MPSSPNDPTDPLEAADWLEVEALVQPDHNSSLGDLERQVQRSGMVESEDGGTDRVLVYTLSELESREIAAADAYPFDVGTDMVSLKGGSWQSWITYVFCLVLSFKGHPASGKTQPAARLFEEISEAAAQGYLSGEAFRFGFPAAATPRNFSQAIERLQTLLADGPLHQLAGDLDAKDDALDVVAWRHHPDRRAGKIVMFAQCASGDNWVTKTAELQPDAFIDKWIPGSIPSPVLRGFFMPHRTPSDPEDPTRPGVVVW